MRLFKRRCSDPSPQLVSLSHIEEPRVIEPTQIDAETSSPTFKTPLSSSDTNFASHRGVSDSNLSATASRLLPRKNEQTPQNHQDCDGILLRRGGFSGNTNASFSSDVGNDVGKFGHDSRHKMVESEPASRETSAERSNKKGLTTWSKKVSRRWDVLRRSDSSEIPTTPDSCIEHRANTLQNNLSSSSGGRRQQYSLSSNSGGGSNDDISSQNQKRVSRVESIRNLFGRQKDKSDGQEFKKRFDDIVSKVGVNTVLRNKRKSLQTQQNQSPNTYELNEKQLLEYLLLCRPEGCNRSLDELIQNFKDTVRNGSGDKGATLSGVNKRLGVLREENQNANRYFNNSHRHSAPVVAQTPGTSSTTNTPLSVDDLCAVLNGILASSNNGVPSNRVLRPTDESGYDSDSTRTGSPRGSERGVDSPRSSPRGSERGSIKGGILRGSQMSSKRGSLEEQVEDDQLGFMDDGSARVFERMEGERTVGDLCNDKRLSYNTANQLLESMCADSSLNDSNSSKNLLEGFNTSIRTLTNISGLNEHNVDLDKTPIAYTGDTADEHSSSDEENVDQDCNTLTRKSYSDDTSTIRRRRSNSLGLRNSSTQSTSESINLNNTTASKNNLFLDTTNDSTALNKLDQPILFKQPSYDVVFHENLNSLPSFSRMEMEFSSLKTLKKTSTGLDNDEVQKQDSVPMRVTDKFERRLEVEGESSDDDCNSEQQQEPVVRPGVVDEIVENFENRVRSTSISNTGTILRKGLLHVSSNEKEFKCVRIYVKDDEFCGLLVEKADAGSSFSPNSGSNQRTGCILIVGIEKNTPASLNGSFRINDELVKVNGRRMRGLSLKDVREYLNQAGELEIVISRLKTPKTPLNSAYLTKASCSTSKIPSMTQKIGSSNTLFQSKSTTTLFKNKTFGDNYSSNFGSFSTFQNRSKSFQDQNWTLAQKTVPKIGQLYTPIALSNSRAKSFIDDKVKTSYEDQIDATRNLFSKSDDTSSMLVWNHKAKVIDSDDLSSRLCAGPGQCEITIKSQKRIKNVEDKPEILVNGRSDNAETVVRSGRNPNAPKIVGGTLKPNVNPEDVQIKKEKLNIDRSFEIESPVKKFAASPAKLASCNSISRRSSPAKLTGMKKFYYGHQKRRSLQAILSPERPQAEPIMSSKDNNDEDLQSRETSNQNPTNNKDQDRLSWTNQEPDNKSKDQLKNLRSRNIQGNKIFGSFQSIPEHCDVGVNKQGSGSSFLADRSSKYDQRLQEPVPKVISRPAELLRVQFVKGAGRPSLGFTIAGGSDSPKGSMGIYVKTVLPGGQAEKQGCLRTGDEILSVNTVPLSGLTRTQATAVFAKVRTGTVTLRVLRRGTAPPTELPTASNRCSRCDFTNFTNHTNHGVGYDYANNTNALSRSSTYIISPGEGDYSDSDMTDLSIADVGSNRGTYDNVSNNDNGFGFADNAYHAGIGQGDDVDGDFDMCRDIEEVRGSGGYIKRAKRLYSAITTNF